MADLGPHFDLFVTALGWCVIANAPSVLRRKLFFAYTPIYFTVFPLADLDDQLNAYIGDWHTESDTADRGKRKRLIRSKAVVSSMIDGLLIPMLMGILIAGTSDRETLRVFVIIYIALRLTQFISSFSKMKDYTSTDSLMESPVMHRLLTGVYALFLVSFVWTVHASYDYSKPYFLSRSYSGLVTGLFDRAIVSIILPFVILPALVAALTTLTLQSGNIGSNPGKDP